MVLVVPAGRGSICPASASWETGSALRPSPAGLWWLAQSARGLGPPQASARSCLPDRAPSPPPVPPAVLLDEIEAAELEGNDDRLEGVLCGAVKQLKVTRAKPDSTLYLSLMYLAKIKPNIFATEGVIEVRAGRPLLHPGKGQVEARRASPATTPSLAGSVQPPAAGRLHQLQGQGEQPGVRAGLQPPHGRVRGG